MPRVSIVVKSGAYGEIKAAFLAFLSVLWGEGLESRNSKSIMEKLNGRCC